MKICVFSDTHGRAQRMIDAAAQTPHELVLHLGDCVSDVREFREAFPDENVRYVAGNDLYDVLSQTPRREIFMLGKVVVFMTHGHDYGVSGGISRLYQTAQAVGAKLVLYGHTHVPHLEISGGITFFNPGACSHDRSGMGESWGLITIEGEKIDCELRYF